MPFTVEHILDNPVVIASATRPFDVLKDFPEMMEAAATVAYEISENPYIIYDFSEVEDMAELAGAFMNMLQGVPGSVADDEVRVLVVGVDDEWVLVRQRLRQDNYGDPDVPLFDTVSEALQFIQLNK